MCIMSLSLCKKMMYLRLRKIKEKKESGWRYTELVFRNDFYFSFVRPNRL